jgi:glycosyltransferase involved in cell wall biosynthesis
MTLPRLRILYVEPFEGGSHAHFGAMLRQHLDHEWTMWTLPGRHWKWRMRGAGLWFAERGEHRGAIDLLIASSYTPLTDLVALRGDLHGVPRVLYFHENQWEYPSRDTLERDHHLAFTQVTSAAAADLCLFNSQFNRDTFLRATRAFVARMPDARPTAIVEGLARRCEVLPVPVEQPAEAPCVEEGSDPSLLILWNHRWEHDKRPDEFFAALEALEEMDVPYRLAICGQAFGRTPPVFAAARDRFRHRIAHWGTVEDRRAYEALLWQCDVVVSTAAHEFFGISVVEAALAGCRPLVPDGLAYPEVIPARYRYRGRAELVGKLTGWARARAAGQKVRLERSPAFVRPYLTERVAPQLEARLIRLVRDHRSPR